MPVVVLINQMPIGSDSTQKNQIKNPPKIEPKLLPEPPTITITQMTKVYLNGVKDIGVNCPSSVVIIAPATPIIADPSTKTWRCLWETFFPIARAAVSLSLIARIIRPHGDRKAFSDSQKKKNKTIKKSAE